MNDRDIWESSFSNKEETKKFETKPGPPLTEEQVRERKEALEKQKQEKIIESLQDQINILKETVSRLEKVVRNNLQIKHKPQIIVKENDESKITKKETE